MEKIIKKIIFHIENSGGREDTKQGQEKRLEEKICFIGSLINR